MEVIHLSLNHVCYIRVNNNFVKIEYTYDDGILIDICAYDGEVLNQVPLQIFPDELEDSF